MESILESGRALAAARLRQNKIDTGNEMIWGMGELGCGLPVVFLFNLFLKIN
jgi:hypothetical protein